MENNKFYKVLDEEFQKIIESEIDKSILNRLKQDQQKKSYAFLVWFLKFYSGINNVTKYITDGRGDNSCDIILDRMSSQGEKTFYLIQSKWNNAKNCNGEFNSETLKSYLSDIQSIIRGDKEKTANDLFNSRYDELLNHIRSNGSVKVLYITLKNSCSEAKENIASLERAIGGNIQVEGFDINRLKMDYIDRNYKKSCPPNPLDKIYNPEYEKINLQILRDDECNHLKTNKPFEAHVFNIQPKMVFQLVERYGVSLFEKNVRNPLTASAINSEIKNTLLNNPSYFWYYNNGITAISRFIPSISNQAESFEVIGLQIINGAQTAYSIYLAYLDATPVQREIIDAEARITLRLLKSGGKDFDLKVTKYTNSQNPVSDRDFWSSDDIQDAIQTYFYGTNIWYERRTGEFRKVPKEIVKVENFYVANAYLSFWLTDPVSVFDAAIQRENKGFDLIFTSHKENKEGLYEKIFNKETNPESVFASYCMFKILTDGRGFTLENVFFSNGFHLLAISKILLIKYLRIKFGNDVNLSEYISKAYKRGDINLFKKCIAYSSKRMKDEIESTDNEDKQGEMLINLMTKRSHFELLVEKISKESITIDDIDSLPIKNSEESELEELDEQELEKFEDTTFH